MKISIEYDENKGVFIVQFDRGILKSSTNGGGWPPPPPYNNQVQELGAWLGKMYPDAVNKFKDQEISGLSLEFTPSPGQK